MTPENNEPQSETIELREKIAALDAELTEDFKSPFSVGPAFGFFRTSLAFDLP